MVRDDTVEPRLGRIRARGRGPGSRYLAQVLRSMALAGGPARRGARTRFEGNRIGRGAGVGRVLASRDRYAAFRARRVIVKSRIVKLGGQGQKAARLHLRYIQRDGVTRDGRPGELYDKARDGAHGQSFLERAEGDRHQFRFIVSAEDAAEYEDLRGFVRRFMTRMEEDLGTELDWVAVDHHNTGHPHTHVILRGRDERGKDLIIAREYLAHGMRERAAELVTFDLGPRSDLEIENRLRQEIEQERFTGLDRSLLRERDAEGFVRSGTGRGDAFRQSLRAGRLHKLRRLGMAEEVAPGRWKLIDGLEATLRRMGERGDIIKTMHREMTQRQVERSASDYIIHGPSDPRARPIVGRIVARGLSDEINDRHYLIVDGVDGRTHYVDIGRSVATDPTAEGSIVEIVPRRAEPRPSDRTVAEVAAAHEGRYSADIHLKHDPSATAAFAEAHVRRLEAMRCQGIGVRREPDGTWIIEPNHVARAMEFEQRQVRAAPVIVTTLSALPLDRLAASEGATWLDRELIADAPVPLRDAGFGREVRDVLARRRQWLMEQNLAWQEQDRIIYRANLLAILRTRELSRVAGQLSGELGLTYAEVRPGGQVEGIYRRRIDLVSGRFALIEKSREFALVPWRPVLERNLGKPVVGRVRGDTISWTVGRQRGPGVR